MQSWPPSSYCFKCTGWLDKSVPMKICNFSTTDRDFHHDFRIYRVRFSNNPWKCNWKILFASQIKAVWIFYSCVWRWALQRIGYRVSQSATVQKVAISESDLHLPTAVTWHLRPSQNHWAIYQQNSRRFIKSFSETRLNAFRASTMHVFAFQYNKAPLSWCTSLTCSDQYCIWHLSIHSCRGCCNWYTCDCFTKHNEHFQLLLQKGRTTEEN